jgi:type II secretory pathway pseudopilin PulG
LIELAMVLMILAILATVALNTVDLQIDQARFEATRKSLRTTVDAIVGDREQPQRNSFVVDCGRLPQSLTELLVKPDTLVASGFFDFDSDRDGSLDVRLRSGWAGPYVQTQAGFPSPLIDGWGNRFEFESTPNVRIYSKGRNAETEEDEIGYDADVGTTLETADLRYSATFRLRVAGNVGLEDPAPSTGEKLGLLVYGVNFDATDTDDDGRVEESTLVVPFPESSVEEQPIDFEYSITESDAISLIGNIAVRGIIWNDSNDDDTVTDGEMIVRKSVVKYFRLFGNESVREELVLY